MIMSGMFGLLLSDKKFVTDSIMSPKLPAVITELTIDWWVTPPCPTVPPTNGTENNTLLLHDLDTLQVQD